MKNIFKVVVEVVAVIGIIVMVFVVSAFFG
jgi:hypothetical protein